MQLENIIENVKLVNTTDGDNTFKMVAMVTNDDVV